MSTPTTDINISLEPHLFQSLKPIHPLLPQEIAQRLEQYISDSGPPLIPYQVLFNVSQWTRTDQGQKKLRTNGLDPHVYSMISLLAGTTTSPERKFGDYVPPKDPEQIEADRIRERKSITTLINALLSIGGVGFAAWWAGDKTGWTLEWRALFSLFAAFLVAIAEAGLYMIWASRQTKLKAFSARTRSARHKKVDPAPELDIDPNDAPKVITEDHTTLRHRK